MTTPVAPPSAEHRVGTRRGAAAGLAAAVIVGGSVPVTGMLDAYPVIAGQALRYALGGLLLLGFARLRGKALPLPALGDLPALVTLAASGMIGFQAFLLLAQRYAEPGLVAAVLGVSPLVIALAGPLMAGGRPSAAPVLGAVLATGGVAVLTGGGDTEGPGLLLAVLAMLCETSFTLCAVGVLGRLGPLATATWSCFVAGVGGALVATITGGASAWRLPDARELAALLVLAVLVTAVAFGAWYFAVGALGADRAGVLIGVMPVSGLAVSLLLGAQTLDLADVLGTALVATAVTLGLRRRQVSGSRGPCAGRRGPRRAVAR
ncbi:DMT family transporter [Amycolatopsis aidingensis]|uniref:DMT family transporter n=1 Tax=Amycolatopsis aidingensis TaxID=2842453 RepID=UPI001C0D5CEB|nr:DMT family transporter [Amycolatopsis aidingensis]